VTDGKRWTAAVLPLLVGGLLGFIGGYFAGGGGRPAGAPSASSASAKSSEGGDAIAELKKNVEKDPQNPRVLTALGNAYYDRGDWEHAADAYERARRRSASDANLLSDLGVAYRNQGEFKRAAAMFRKAREVNPDHWQSLLNLVLLEAFDRRDASAAQREFDELKRRFPEIPNLDRLQQQIAKIRA
jgi:tetratricopeptide (TPR) repeat protein